MVTWLKSKWGASVLLFAWGLLLFGGFAGLWFHEGTPGEAAAAPANWPLASQLPHPQKPFTLVVFAHPKCPCFRNSEDALHRLVTEGGDSLSCTVVVAHPASEPEAWTQDFGNWFHSDLPSVCLIDDVGLLETKRFGARTSGEAMLFDAEGHLCFHGGLTPLRGHAGRGGGETQIVEILAGRPAAETAKVFGCSLGVNQSVR